MTNTDLEYAVYRAVPLTVSPVVCGAVDHAVYHAVYRAVYRAVNLAVYEVVNVAVHVAVSRREEPTHPGLAFYLAAVG